MAAAVEKEPPGQAFAQPLLYQQGRRAEHEHTDVRTAGPAVPEQFEGFAPAADLLQLVEDEQHRLAGCGDPGRGAAPLQTS